MVPTILPPFMAWRLKHGTCGKVLSAESGQIAAAARDSQIRPTLTRHGERALVDHTGLREGCAILGLPYLKS